MNNHSDGASSLRGAVCGWLEAEGWVMRVGENGAMNGLRGQFSWLAVACQEGSHVVLAAPAACPDALVLSHFFTLDAADRARVDQLPAAVQSQLAWDLLSTLHDLQVDYIIDRPVPHEVLLMLRLAPENVTRDVVLHRMLLLSTGFHMVLLSYAKALGAAVPEAEPAAAAVH